jgi:hypothetical protein
VRLVFHATAVHAAEHRLLAPIVSRLLARHEALTAEVIAQGPLARIWPPHERLTLLPQLKWPDYRAHAEATGADIALAPLTASYANATRSPTRRIDVARLGAAGIFSVFGPYTDAAAAGELTVPDDPAAWEAAIDRMIADPGERARRAAATQEAVAAMRAAGGPLPLD